MRIPSFRTALASLALALLSIATTPHHALAVGSVVISQVYGGGGNAGATLKNDFIELHNRSSSAVSLAGWTVQYASSAGSTWSSTALSGSIPAGGYYLVQEAAGTGGVPGPTPDATGAIAMAAASGKVALVNTGTLLTVSCPTGSSIIDFVGYGAAATCAEGSPTANLSNTTAALRGNLGCTDTDANSSDFATGAAAPRNSATAAYQCEFTLTYIAGANGSISGTTPQTVANGGSGTAVTAVPDPNYHFVSWSDGVLTATRTDSPVTADLTVTASFAIDEFTLTYNAGANGTISGTSPQTVAYGGSGTAVTAVPDPNYHFVSWSDGVLTATRTDSPVTANLTVTASFAIDEFTLTYNAGANGTISGTSPQTVAYGGSGSAVTAVPDVGYHFVSWSDGVLTASRTDGPITANLTVSASFAINQYTLTYTAGANGTISGTSPQTVAHGGSGSAVTAVPDAGYHFVSWSDGVLTASRTDNPVTADVTVSASFAINEYTLTYNAGPNGTISGTTPQVVAEGGSGTAVTAVPDAGYHFVSWSDGVLTASRTDGPINADLTVSASFAINEYTLTYNAGANGTISGTTPQTVAHGGSGSAVTAVPDAGYHFVSWSDGVLTASRTDGPITANLTVSASFAINEYTLTYNAGANGTISGTTPQTVAHGGSGTAVTAVPDPGYHFVTWSDGVLTATRTDSPVTADLSVSASFAIDTFTLTYTAGANGTISGTTPQVVPSGGSGTAVTAVPDPGYHFVSWSDGVLTATRTDSPVTADLSVSASFAINQYTLTYNAGANGTISGTTPQTVAHGGSGSAVTAVPDAGYHFVSWSDGVLTASRTDGPITANLTVSASFAINLYTLTYLAGPNGSISGTTPQVVASGGSGSAVSAVPDPGYQFASWSDGVLTATRTDSPVTADLTVTASFQLIPVLVISQVYGGGGNAGAPLHNDYIEIFNRGPGTVSLTGWTVQYASAAGTTWQTTLLAGSIVPGGYYLVQEAAGANPGPALPTPDAIGTIPMNATTGKVALVHDTAPLSGSCPSGPAILDLVGYGAASCSEGSPTPPISNTTADFRKGGGCTDTNDNLADFLIAGPAPRNSASPLNTCSGVLTVVIDAPGMGTVAVVPNQPSYPNGTPVQLTASANIPGGFHFVSWGGDATGSSNPLNLVMNGDRTVIAHFAANTPVGRIVISQISGGGGNGAAPYLNDYVELYNRGSLPVNITGWSLQYASSTGSSWSSTNLIGTIPPGHYYLIQQQAGVGTGAALPAPDAIGVINLSASTGKVALVNSGVVLSGNCPSGANIIDFVGYGAADCSEGPSPAGAADNLTAEFRNSEGCDDSNRNSLDFALGAPAPRNSATPEHICSEWLAVDDGITNFTLGNAMPNPARGFARIPFALPREADVKLEVIDVLGRVAATLVDGRLPAGRHEVKWDGTGRGGALPPGIYLMRMRVAGTMLVRRVTLMR